jgi:hypothetical protein
MLPGSILLVADRHALWRSEAPSCERLMKCCQLVGGGVYSLLNATS